MAWCTGSDSSKAGLPQAAALIRSDRGSLADVLIDHPDID
jgi:hypothetical protein